MTQRTERIDELLRQEIGEILAREVKDPDIGFATITDVETAADLRHARVWVSVIGQADERAASIAALQRAMGFVRHELGERLRLRRIPELHVRLDDSIERGTRILRILDQLGAGETPDDRPAGESLPTPVPRPGRDADGNEPPATESAEAALPPAGRPTKRRPAKPGRNARGRPSGPDRSARRPAPRRHR
ncbi:MAG TPA: 30S ribosome-binding factor RbfA [Candidatus Limnocylindrales bacterium]